MRKPFERDEKYTAAITVLTKFTAHQGMGFLLTYVDVERLTGFRKGTAEFDYVLRVKFVSDMRRHRNIVLQAVRNLGYRFMTGNEVVEERIPLRARKARNQWRRGEKEVDTALANIGKLSIKNRRLAISEKEYVADRRKEVNRALKSLRKTETLPTRKPM